MEPAKESEVFFKIKTAGPRPPDAAPTAEIQTSELKRVIDAGREPLILDVDERADFAKGHIPGAVNIPADELDVRAINELSPSDPVVVYCRCVEDGISTAAAGTLLEQGFRHVSVLRGACPSGGTKDSPWSSGKCLPMDPGNAGEGAAARRA